MAKFCNIWVVSNCNDAVFWSRVLVLTLWLWTVSETCIIEIEGKIWGDRIKMQSCPSKLLQSGLRRRAISRKRKHFVLLWKVFCSGTERREAGCKQKTATDACSGLTGGAAPTGNTQQLFFCSFLQEKGTNCADRVSWFLHAALHRERDDNGMYARWTEVVAARFPTTVDFYQSCLSTFIFWKKYCG